MQVTIQVPEISECQALACGYNFDGRCHAQAITVGDGIHPMCDTFMPAATHKAPAARGGVGACKVASCVHNRDYSCHAVAIHIGLHEAHPDCLTFSRRPR